MNSRQQNILEIIIREYQKTGQPVASGILVDKYGLHLSPATIRAEMLVLDEEGLLVQPHTSAGRVPTTKAYRLFVNQLMDKKELNLKNKEKLRKELKKFDEETIFSQRVAQFLADFSHNLGISGSFGNKIDFHGAGLPFLLEDPEFTHSSDMLDILRGFEEMERKFTDFFSKLDEEMEVFIGEENPIDDFDRCSLIISGYKSDRGEGFIGILGPKRMNYARNIFLVQETKKLIKNN